MLRATLAALRAHSVVGQALTSSDFDTSVSTLDAATTEVIIGSDLVDPSFWTRSTSVDYDPITVHVGDKLIFKYSADPVHNVYLAANETSWNSCSAAGGEQLGGYYPGGNPGPMTNACSSAAGCTELYEVVPTSPGVAYIFCQPHCSLGQRIKITVSPPPAAPPSPPPALPPPFLDAFVNSEPYALVRPEKYPNAAAEHDGVGGTLLVQARGGSLYFHGLLTGLPASITAGWHVHEGFGCVTTAGPGGHYMPDGGADPWSGLTYTSDANGVAEIEFSIAGFNLAGTNPVLGKALVIHSTTDRIGCGIIIPTTAEMTEVTSYPGAASSVRGLPAVNSTGNFSSANLGRFLRRER